MILRIADPEDAPALLDIYAYYVENTTVTFEYAVPPVEEFRERILRTLKRYPYVVAEADGRPVGYAYASAFKGRAAYDWSAETSVYVREGLHRQGVGSLLYRELERLLAMQNLCNLCACIALPNPESTAFHERFGYRTCAHFHQSGYKFGEWIDMIWMEKTLCPHEAVPKAFVPYSRLSADSFHRRGGDTDEKSGIHLQTALYSEGMHSPERRRDCGAE